MDNAPPTVKIANDITHVLFRRDDLYLHHGLQQDRAPYLCKLSRCHRGRNLECHLVGINVVIGAVINRSLESQQGVPGEDTVLHLLLNAFLNSGNVFLWNHATDYLIFKFQPFLAFVISGCKLDPDMSVLASSARLAHKFTFNLHGITNALTVRDLRLTDIRLYAELSPHPVNDDIQMQLAHP